MRRGSEEGGRRAVGINPADEDLRLYHVSGGTISASAHESAAAIDGGDLGLSIEIVGTHIIGGVSWSAAAGDVRLVDATVRGGISYDVLGSGTINIVNSEIIDAEHAIFVTGDEVNIQGSILEAVEWAATHPTASPSSLPRSTSSRLQPAPGCR